MKKQAFAYILAKACIFWCGRQELKQLNKGENGGFLRENGQKKARFFNSPRPLPVGKIDFSTSIKKPLPGFKTFCGKPLDFFE